MSRDILRLFQLDVIKNKTVYWTKLFEWIIIINWLMYMKMMLTVNVGPFLLGLRIVGCYDNNFRNKHISKNVASRWREILFSSKMFWKTNSYIIKEPKHLKRFNKEH